MLTVTLFIGILLATMASSWHCALMCGGISASVCKSTKNLEFYPNKKTIFFDQLLIHASRISSYMALGAIAGWFGIAFWQQEIIPIQRGLFVITAGILIYQAYRLIHPKGKKISTLMGQGVATFFAKIWAKNFDVKRNGWQRWITGMIWGMVPCTLVYGVLALAFLSGDPWVGAMLMLALGLGTLPTLLLLTRITGSLMQFSQQSRVRYLAAGILIMTALWGLYRGITLPSELLKGGFCLN